MIQLLVMLTKEASALLQRRICYAHFVHWASGDFVRSSDSCGSGGIAGVIF
jgi:hypothetical protein